MNLNVIYFCGSLRYIMMYNKVKMVSKGGFNENTGN